MHEATSKQLPWFSGRVPRYITLRECEAIQNVLRKLSVAMVMGQAKTAAVFALWATAAWRPRWWPRKLSGHALVLLDRLVIALNPEV